MVPDIASRVSVSCWECVIMSSLRCESPKSQMIAWPTSVIRTFAPCVSALPGRILEQSGASAKPYLEVAMDYITRVEILHPLSHLMH